MSVRVAMIAAVAENGVIGDGNAIPWRIPSDFAYFKRTTMGKPLIMGRKTFESIGKPLPGRTNIVVTRQKDYQPDGVIVVDSLYAALVHARAIAEADSVDEIMIGGGGEIYRQGMQKADRLYISHVAARPVGYSHFPQIEENTWILTDTPKVEPSEKDSHPYKISIYDRRGGSAH